MTGKDRSRLLIAQEAARILAEEGFGDYLPAKQKAAARLGFGSAKLPTNEEVEMALAEFHRLYRADVQPKHVLRLRKLAVEAMEFLQGFEPRLSGGALEGTAGDHCPIALTVFADPPEQVHARLLDARIPFSECEFTLADASGRATIYPGIAFLVDDVKVELLILPLSRINSQPGVRREHTAARNKGDLPSVRALILESESYLA